MKRLGIVGVVIAANAGLVFMGRSMQSISSVRFQPVAWTELTESDFPYRMATRVAVVDGRRIHYPTPTAELARLLASSRHDHAPRYLAEVHRELGDWDAAWKALLSWAESGGSWEEAARWAGRHGRPRWAMDALERAVADLAPEAGRELLWESLSWLDGEEWGELRIECHRRLLALDPDDFAARSGLIQELQVQGRSGEAGFVAFEAPLTGEEKLLLQVRLHRDAERPEAVFLLLDKAITEVRGAEACEAYARAVDTSRPDEPDRWRRALEDGYDEDALLRYVIYLRGRGRPDDVVELLAQMERRHPHRFDRPELERLSRLYEDVGEARESFRLRMSAAAGGDADQQADDLAELARLALEAGARPLGWGIYNQEPLAWAGRVDRTPGIWTGTLSLLMTGRDWPEALRRLERAQLSDRTFLIARILLSELRSRQPAHPRAAGLLVSVMRRHLERGEAQEVLRLREQLSQTGAEGPVLEEADGLAVAAARQLRLPLSEEVELLRRHLRRIQSADARRDALREAVERLEQRDPSHLTAVSLILEELDFNPDDERLWLRFADDLEAWGLDDELGGRYQEALSRFEAPGWWARAARWYARRQRDAELAALATELVRRFRGSGLFERAPWDASVLMDADPNGEGAARDGSMVAWADWVRLEALRRYPHSPTVFEEARRALSRRVESTDIPLPEVEAGLLQEREDALLFVDAGARRRLQSRLMERDELEAWLGHLADQPPNPATDALLVDGWVRLSRFEDAVEPGRRLNELYPGDRLFARLAFDLHRSMTARRPDLAEAAQELVARSRHVDSDLPIALGELYHDLGMPAKGNEAWTSHLGQSQDPVLVEDVATALWDYHQMPEALKVAESARLRLRRPGLMTFEVGVLKEEVGDLSGALSEYLAAIEGGDWDARSMATRRLGVLMTRASVRRALQQTIDGLAPADPEAERLAERLLGILTVSEEALVGSVDFRDFEAHPRDPEAREGAAESRRRAAEELTESRRRLESMLAAKLLAMVRESRGQEFLTRVESSASSFSDSELETDLVVACRRRRAELATPIGRVDELQALVRHLWDVGRPRQAREVWSMLEPLLADLDAPAVVMRAGVTGAWLAERESGVGSATEVWDELVAAHPGSLGLFEEWSAFLVRTGQTARLVEALGEAADEAVPSFRLRFLERRVRLAVDLGDREAARRSLAALLKESGLSPDRRLRAELERARLLLSEDPGVDLRGPAKAAEKTMAGELRPDLWAGLARLTAEHGRGASIQLWIEALRRRLDTGWLREAAVHAEEAGNLDRLEDYFRRQAAASPRDVRWPVALRDLAAFSGRSDAALEYAEKAVELRPEEEKYLSYLVDLLVRLGRPVEAAEHVRTYADRHPAVEWVVAWRSGLLVGAGLADEALEVERQALLRFAELSPDDAEEWGTRWGSAVDRLLDNGAPAQAWSLLADGDPSLLPIVDLGVEVALRSGHIDDHLATLSPDDWRAAGWVVAREGRSEDLDRVAEFLMGTLQRDPASFSRVWSFVQNARMEPGLRYALARALLEAEDGPWSADLPRPFVTAVGDAMVGRREGVLQPLRPNLDAIWVAHLVNSRQPEPLWVFLEGRWSSLLQQCRAGASGKRLAWASWLDGGAGVEVWSSALAARPERVAALAEVMTERGAWRSFLDLAAGSWKVDPLAALLDAESRARWAVVSDRVPPEVEEVARRMPAYLEGAGPIGSVAGENAGLAVAAWGELPSTPYLVVETLARFAEGDPRAAWLPLEDPRPATFALRRSIASRLGMLLGVTLPSQVPTDAAPEVIWLSLQHQADPASRTETLTRIVRADQGRLSPVRFRALRGVAILLDLADPITLLDPDQPISSELWAAIFLDEGAVEASRFACHSPVELRWKLRDALSGREKLTREESRFYLHHVWAHQYSALRPQWLQPLGGGWPFAHEWLVGLPFDERSAALSALDHPEHLEGLLKEDSPAGLWIYAHLVQGRTDEALRRLEEALETPDLVESRLLEIVEPFQSLGKADLVRPRAERYLERRLQEGRSGPEAWKLLWDLSSDRAGLARLTERAWLRGDIEPDRLMAWVVEVGTRSPELARRLAAHLRPRSAADALRIAEVLVKLQQPGEAETVLSDAWERFGFTVDQQVRAFDRWRDLPGESGPAPWRRARAFLADPAGLTGHLLEHPWDVVAARAGLADDATRSEASLAASIEASEGRGGLTRAESARLRLHWVWLRRDLPPSAALLPVRGRPLPSLLSELQRDGETGVPVEELLSLAGLAARAGSERLYHDGVDALLRRRPARSRRLAEVLGLEVQPPSRLLLLPKDLDWAILEELVMSGGGA